MERGSEVQAFFTSNYQGFKMTAQLIPAASAEVILPAGTIFYRITDLGRKQKERVYEIMEYLGNDLYRCKLLADNTIGRVNPDFRQTLEGEEIRELIKYYNRRYTVVSLK